MIPNKTEVLNLKTRKTQVSIGYLSIFLKIRVFFKSLIVLKHVIKTSHYIYISTIKNLVDQNCHRQQTIFFTRLLTIRSCHKWHSKIHSSNTTSIFTIDLKSVCLSKN
jgi:hypothetical protein